MPPKRKAPASKSASGGKKQKKEAKPAAKSPAQKSKTADSGGMASSDGGVSQYLAEPGWQRHLKSEFEQPYFQELESQLSKEYKSGAEIFPPTNLIFNAFKLTPIDKVSVVILGQDPYHDNGQAHGLSFSVPHDIKAPPSLVNIYKELTTDIPGFKAPNHGNLESWAKQGVLLLNATLTVQAHKPNSHAKFGWQKFTDNVIRLISDQCEGVVFILWGGFAQKKEKLIDGKKHHVIKTAHPSPLSVTKFLGCKCFSAANKALVKFGKPTIHWQL